MMPSYNSASTQSCLLTLRRDCPDQLLLVRSWPCDMGVSACEALPDMRLLRFGHLGRIQYLSYSNGTAPLSKALCLVFRTMSLCGLALAELQDSRRPAPLYLLLDLSPRPGTLRRQSPKVSQPHVDTTRGWQRPAYQAVDSFCRRALLRELDAPTAALLESQAGPCAARVFTAQPTSPELTLQSPLFRALPLRRLRMPLPLTAARCRCMMHACGLPALRRVALAWRPLRASCGACLQGGRGDSCLVRDLNVAPTRPDERRIEVIANGLPLWGGAQPSVDTTQVSLLTAAGMPRRDRGITAGAALRVAERAKARTYPELAQGNRCRLVVLGIEVGGRWSPRAVEFVRLLARSRARAAPVATRAATAFAFALRWSALLSFAAARSFAVSLLSVPLFGTANVDGEAPS